MAHWWMSQTAMRVWVGAASVLALLSGYVGATWLIERTPPPPVAAAVPAGENVAEADGPAEPVASRPVVIHGTGDVLLDPTQLGALAGGYNAPWTGVRDLFGVDDVTVVNLECSPGEGGTKQEKQFTFRCPNGFAAMRASGVEAANLGNNHSGDYGREALASGLASLDASGVEPVGAGRNVGEANSAAIFERGGQTIAVLGFGGVVPTPSWFATSDRPGVANGYDNASMVEAVKQADQRADIVVVSIHWGAELDTQPRGDDVARAHALIDAGADVIFGHHAHVLQPLAFYNERPIFFGLGNFVWPRGGPTAIARAIVRPDGGVEACLLPARINGGRPELTAAAPDGCP